MRPAWTGERLAVNVRAADLAHQEKHRMQKPIKIKDCMRRNPLTINHEANLVQAVETLVEFMREFERRHG